jgi:GH15 family glucan-1,4-alpha-glucosidase
VITDASRVPLSRRAWLGDGVRGATVAADGTIDWFCPAGISGDPALWYLVDPAGGAVRVGPVREGTGAPRSLPQGSQGYKGATNVVETILHGRSDRVVSVVDLLPWEGPGQLGIGRAATGRIVRLVRALAGPVEIEIEVVPTGRPGGTHTVASAAGVLAVDGLEVRAPAGFAPAPVSRDSQRWRAVLLLQTGEEVAVTVGPPGQAVSPGAARRLLEDTELAWSSWAARIAYDGPYAGAIERALLAVRALTGPEGAPVSAGTTSLPRRSGGERTSDDRFVAVRDAARAARVLARAGLAEDAEDAEGWLRRAVEAIPRPWPQWLCPDIQPVPDLEETTLAGWRRSQPVVTGRPGGLYDVGLLGEVAAAVGASMLGPGGRPGDPGPLSAARPSLASAANWTCDYWTVPDAGPWEVAKSQRLYVAGRIGAWYGLDRLARLAREANPLDLDAVTWQQESRSMMGWLESAALAPDGGLRLDGTAGASDDADAALLSVAWRGPWPADGTVVAATVDRVLERLGSGPLVHRYSEDLDGAGPDNPDLAASFDAVLALARMGRWEDAHDRMEGLLALLGPMGLPAQTADPLSGEIVGNLPSTSTALALTEAALALAAGPR